jgi:hypothetical protein
MYKFKWVLGKAHKTARAAEKKAMKKKEKKCPESV